MPFVRAAKTSEIPAGTIREVNVAGQVIALAEVDGKYYAISNICLHRGGPLAQGPLNGKNLICPWHGWEYDVTTGKTTMNPNLGVASYPTEVRGDEVFVDVDEPFSK
jgi:nitrite reductase (NADH) small subunit